MQAEIKRAWSQWFVIPQDGGRGGIAVASHAEGVELCKARNWEVIDRKSQVSSVPKETPHNYGMR